MFSNKTHTIDTATTHPGDPRRALTRTTGICLLTLGMLLGSRTTSASPVDAASVSGTAHVLAENGFLPAEEDTSPVAFPDSGSQAVHAGFSNSQAEVEYELYEVGDTAVFDVSTWAYTGDGGTVSLGRSEFDVTFTTTVDTYYDFIAVSPETGAGTTWFESTFNGSVANKHADHTKPGGMGGTFPTDSHGHALNTFEANGLLPAGTHTLTVAAQGLWLDSEGQGSVMLSLTPALRGDLDGDGFVGITDLNLILANWNQSVPPADAAADVDGDGYVGVADLNTVLSHWNNGTPPAGSAIAPEPASLALLAAGLTVLGRRIKPGKPTTEPSED